MRVLLVEADDLTAEVIDVCFTVRWPGTVVLRAAEALRALSLARSERPDLILLDMNLPDMDGLDFLKAMKKTSGANVIVLGTGAHRAENVRMVEAGASAYILKPFLHGDLLSQAATLASR